MPRYYIAEVARVTGGTCRIVVDAPDQTQAQAQVAVLMSPGERILSISLDPDHIDSLALRRPRPVTAEWQEEYAIYRGRCARAAKGMHH